MAGDNLYFISLEGKAGYRIGEFELDEKIPLPVYVADGKQLSLEDITPDNIIGGMFKILIENPENDHIDYYRQFIYTVQPDIEPRLTSGAYELEKQQKYQDALDIYRTLYALNPASMDNLLNLAVCYDEYSQLLFSRGKNNEAEKMEELAYDYFKILETWADKPDRVCYYLGRFYAWHENYEKAVPFLSDFIKLTDDEERKKEVLELIDQIKNQGITDDDYKMTLELIESQKESEALEFVDRYISKYPESWHGYYLKGQIFRKLDNFKEAIVWITKALQYNQDSGDLYNELGLNYMNLSDFKQSEIAFTHALRYSPDDLAIYSNLAILFYKKGNKLEAIRYCDTILYLNPDDLYAKDLKKIILEDN